jgi:hypothetical protein
MFLPKGHKWFNSSSSGAVTIEKILEYMHAQILYFIQVIKDGALCF